MEPEGPRAHELECPQTPGGTPSHLDLTKTAMLGRESHPFQLPIPADSAQGEIADHAEHRMCHKSAQPSQSQSGQQAISINK